MLRRTPLPLACIALSGTLVAAGCGATTNGAATAAAVWPSGFPDDAPAIVTIENWSFDPPRCIGLVTDDHPLAQGDGAGLGGSGFKRVDRVAMDALLDELEARDFLDHAAPSVLNANVDPRVVLRRLSVTVGADSCVFLLPRGPSRDAADAFTECAHAVTELFNAVVDLRPDVTRGEKAPAFFAMRERLVESNQRKLRQGGRSQ